MTSLSIIRVLLFVSGLVIGFLSSAWAQETQPGDACTPAQNGWVRTSGGPGLLPKMMICEGLLWQNIAISILGSGGGVTGNPCVTPWGTAISDTYSITAYQTASVQVPDTCNAQVRTCANGTLNGTFIIPSCIATADPCSAVVPVPGALCYDGSVFAGFSPDTNAKMFTTRCDAGMVWSGSTCTGARSALGFGRFGSTTGNTSLITGKANSASLAQYYSDTAAAKHCENLTENGSSDWYLPALNELLQLHLNRLAIGNLDANNAGKYWSSSEMDVNFVRIVYMLSGAGQDWKHTTGYVRCVRR